MKKHFCVVEHDVYGGDGQFDGFIVVCLETEISSSLCLDSPACNALYPLGFARVEGEHAIERAVTYLNLRCHGSHEVIQ